MKLVRAYRIWPATLVVTLLLAGCGWRGANSLPLPGTNGRGPGSYEIQAQLPDVTNIQQNSRVRVGDVTIGNVTKIQRQGWHALVTMRVNADVQLPANATAKIGQTSLLGSLHIELAPPADQPPQGQLRNGSLIPLSHAAGYPTTEQTLAAVALMLNGGGLGKVQDITKAFSAAFAGRDKDLRSLIEQFDIFVGHLNEQTDDMIAAADHFNALVGQFAEQKPVFDKALSTIPDALAVLAAERNDLADTADAVGTFSGVTADAVNRGDYGNATGIFDLTLSRLDELLIGTRWEGNLTELELQWGRTIGQLPSPYTAANPLVVPYHVNQGP
jgi:phospholipid/cholesterol/gamma-HCH transport system substrate-binding protein